MRKERKELGLGFLLLNEGQLPWLPKNPRQWTATDVERTAASIKEDPDFLEDRPLLVVPFDAKNYVVFAGNLRHEGAYAAKRSKVPCVIYYPETEDDQETIRRRAMKDNGSFGAWDWDELFSSPWGTMDLEAMGIGKAFEGGAGFGGGEQELDAHDLEADAINAPGESETGYTSISFLFPISEAEGVMAYIKDNGKDKLVEQIIEICQNAVAK